jgi:hypothetical protein
MKGAFEWIEPPIESGSCCLLRLLRALAVDVFCSRRDLLLENLALRQQLTVLRRRHPQPRFAPSDRLFWVMLRRLWSGWRQALILVQPETVVRWHRAGFKVYWTWLSQHRVRAGRKCISAELRELIFRMTAENSTWGAPRIHGELKMLGIDISDGLLHCAYADLLRDLLLLRHGA